MTHGFDLKAPDQWGLANFGMFFEGEDIDPNHPFAASVVVALRTDAGKGTTPSTMRARDLASMHNSVPSLQVIASGPLKMGGGEPVEHIEWLFPDPAVETIHQIVAYVEVSSRVYTITGTHRHDRFEGVRDDILKFVDVVRKNNKAKGKK